MVVCIKAQVCRGIVEVLGESEETWLLSPINKQMAEPFTHKKMKCEIRKNLFRKIRFHFGTNFF
jgi:hypothetical protein